MSKEYSPGEIVNIAVLGARVVKCDGITILVDLPHQDPIGLYLEDEQVTVERVAPAGGPPQPGDVWHDRNGAVWLATDRADYDVDSSLDIVMIPARPWDQGGNRTPSDLNHCLGPLTLMYREPDTDGGDRP